MLNELIRLTLEKNVNLIGLDDVVEKEILHHDIMYVLHKEDILRQLTFIGGTSLRLCYNSSRLSEDLDFTAGTNFKPEQLEGLGNQIQRHLEQKYGLNVSVREPKLANNNTSTWKVTIEKHPDRPDIPSQKMHIDVCSIPSFDVQNRPIMDHYGINSPMSGLPIPVQSMPC
jgi:Nucleotidyl transferase AbiEii toxin, Type IV TA system